MGKLRSRCTVIIDEKAAVCNMKIISDFAVCGVIFSSCHEMKSDFSASSPWSEIGFAVPSREDSVCGPLIENDSSLLADPWTETYCVVVVTYYSSSPLNENGSVYGAGPSPLTFASGLSNIALWNVNDLTYIACKQHFYKVSEVICSLPSPGRGAPLSSLWLVWSHPTSCFSPYILPPFLTLSLLWLTILSLSALLALTFHESTMYIQACD